MTTDPTPLRKPRHVVVVPVKEHSQRIQGKNFLLVVPRPDPGLDPALAPRPARPLYQILPLTLRAAGVFDQILIDTDSTEVAGWAKGEGFVVLPRRPELATDDANGNDLFRHHAGLVWPNGVSYYTYDCLWQAFVTSPYLSVRTVRAMAAILGGSRAPDDPSASNPHDSVMTVRAHRGFFWTHTGQPVSYRPEVMPRTQDLPPLYQEVCGLFGVTRAGYLRTRTRFGAYPYFYEVPVVEAVDVDWPEDLPGLTSQR